MKRPTESPWRATSTARKQHDLEGHSADHPDIGGAAPHKQDHLPDQRFGPEQ
jgi:hypothetical protein